MKHPAGFTLIELVATLAILGVLASIALPLAEISVQRGREQELRRALRDMREGIDAYKRASDEGRIARDAGGSGYPRSFAELTEGVTDERDPKRAKIYFLRRLPRDPMYPDATVEATASWGKRSYASEAGDPKEGEDIYDVFSRSAGLGLNGVEYRRW